MVLKRVSFSTKIIFSFIFHLLKRPKNNIDWLRFGKDHRPGRVPLKSTIFSLGSYIINKRFVSTYLIFEDKESKDLFVTLLIFKLLGSRYVKLPVNNNEFWRKYNHIDEKYLVRENTNEVGRFKLNLYSIQFDGNLIELTAHPLSILNTFLLKQYCFNRNGVIIKTEKDDTILDIGACWGDTALYFSTQAGINGKVFSFEFGKDNLKIFDANISNNSSLNNIHLRQLAIWNKTGQELKFNDGGPGTSLHRVNDENTHTVLTTTIDNFIKEEGLPRVDFIKMDIEGSEGAALEGAEESIVRFKPKLAISIYHSLKDFTNLPLFIYGLSKQYGLGYKFYLDHFTLYDEETVLFATADYNE